MNAGKNYICEKAIHSDIVISNGEFILTPDFNNYHFNYGVAAPKLVNTKNERGADWSCEDNKILKPLNSDGIIMLMTSITLTFQ